MVKKRVKIPQNKIFETMGDSESSSTPDGLLQPTPGKYVPPKNRIRTDSQCRTMLSKLKETHDTWVEDMLQIKAQFDGAPPLDPEELKKQKLEYRANFNFGHLRTFIEEYLGSEFTLIDSVSHLVDFKFELGDPDLDRFLSRIFSKEWQRVFSQWEELDGNLDFMRKDRSLFGFGFFLHDNSESWRFCHHDALDLYLLPRTRTNPGAMSTFGVRRTWSIEELWEYFLDEANPYWDKDTLGRVLYQYSKSWKQNASANDMGAWLKKVTESIRNHEHNFDNSSDDLDLISIFSKEFDGKWTHLMICENQEPITKDGEIVNHAAPLFFHDRQYKSIKDLIHVFPFTRGEKHLRGHQGLGERLDRPCAGMNRLDNQLIDSTLLSSTVLISTQAGRGKDAKQTKFDLGGIVDIGNGKFEQNLAGANLASSVNTNQYLKGVVRGNTGLQGFNLNEPSDRLKSVGELGLQVAEESVVNKPQVVFFYKQLDDLWRSVVRKQMYGQEDDMVKQWKKRILNQLIIKFNEDEEVAQQIFDRIFDREVDKDEYGLPIFMAVAATRSASSGSKSADILATQRMFQLAPFMHEEARWKFLQRATAAYDDFAAVEEYFPDEQRPNNMTNGIQEAIKENPILKMGVEFPAVEADSHREHAPVHLTDMEQNLQMWIEGQMDVVACDDAIRNVLPHFESHMVFLSQNPMDKTVFESLQGRRGQVLNLARKVQFDASAAREAQAREAQKKQEEIAFQESRLHPNSPENTKIRVDGELEQEKIRQKGARELRATDNFAVIAASKAEREVKIKEQKAIGEAAASRIELSARLRKILAEGKGKENGTGTNGTGKGAS